MLIWETLTAMKRPTSGLYSCYAHVYVIYNVFGMTGVWSMSLIMTMNLTLAGGSLCRHNRCAREYKGAPVILFLVFKESVCLSMWSNQITAELWQAPAQHVSNIIQSGSERAPRLKPRLAGRGCWGWPCFWALTARLPRIWRAVGCYVSRYWKIRSAVEARELRAPSWSPRWMLFVRT